MLAVKKGAPDGYTIGLGGTGTHAINPHLQRAIPYDVNADFTPISPIVSYVNVLVVNNSVPAKTVGELVAYAKKNPTARSEERRVGKECVSTCRSRWSPSH